MVGKIWAYLDGKKTVLGAIIGIVASVVAALPVILPLFVADAALVAQYAGVGLAVLGFLHKAYKFVYKTDVPKE